MRRRLRLFSLLLPLLLHVARGLTDADEIKRLYEKHNPSKLDSVPGLLQKYAGAERDLLLAVRKKYGLNEDGTEKHAPLLDDAGAMRETMNLFEAASALECGPEGMEHLSELPSQGMHVLLLDSEPTACEAAGGTALRLKVYADGVASGEPSALELPCDLDDAAMEPLLSELREKVEAARPLVHARLLRERKLSRDSAKHSRQSADARLEDW